MCGLGLCVVEIGFILFVGLVDLFFIGLCLGVCENSGVGLLVM